MAPDEVDFSKVLNEKKPMIYNKILEYLPHRYPQEYYDIVRDYPERQGKYFRPVLVLLANEMFGGREEDALLTAAAMQTSEDFILIHDDIEDHSEERRGKPCLHKVYGFEISLNAGDSLHVLMWKMLTDNVRILGLERATRILSCMSDILLQTFEGQYLDLSWIATNKLDLVERDYYEMVDRKAGAYSVYGPLQLGAITANATEDEVRSIKEWGIPMGRAYMIYDDFLNIKGVKQSYGKEIGGDILEGKRTLILIHLLKNCTSTERKSISKIYAKKREEKTEKEKSYVMMLMEKYGSIDYAHQKSLEFADMARRIFDRKTSHIDDSFAKKAIRAAIDFVTARSS